MQTFDIDALLAFHRQTFGSARMEGDDKGGSTTTESTEGSGTVTTTGGEDDKATFTQADVDRIVKQRADRIAAAKYADYDDLKTKAAEADKLRQERETENEKAVREAREQAATEERTKVAPRLVSAEFRAAAKGVLTAEQTAALIEDLDLTKYLTDKGEVDVEKVERKVKAFAPADDGKGRRFPDLGQGQRGGGVKEKGAGGASEAARRFASSK